MIELLNGPVIKTLLILIVALIVIVFVVLKTWKKVPNDHAAVIVGLGKPKVVTGGVFLIPLLQRMDVITLETLSLDVNIQNVKTSLGVPINADGYVILKVKADETNILTAMQMFYCNDENRTKNKIVEQVQSLCEGKLREIVSTMTVEEIYDDREKFSASVTEIASKALSEIGLELKSFTINDITEECGVSRMTFYYHFKDIYDLVEWSFIEDAARALEGKKSYDTWQEGFLNIFHAVLENKPFITNVYRSVSREQVELYLYKLVHDLIYNVVEEKAQGLHVPEEDKAFIADFYKYAFVGIMLDWIKNGMTEPPERIIERISILIQGDIARAVGKFCTPPIK